MVPGEGLVANVALVLRVLVLRLRVNGQAGLRLVTLATVHALVGGFLRRVAAANLAALFVNFLVSKL